MRRIDVENDTAFNRGGLTGSLFSRNNDEI